jgi:thiosulfate/3-mercaptopyruvate sulfurtransferase
MITLILSLLAYSAGTIPPAIQAGAHYANPQLIVEAEELAKRKPGDGSIILDVRKGSEYGRGHIPNALHVDAPRWAKVFASNQEPAHWSKELGSLGIDSSDRVIVYGDPTTPDAARIWWILRYWSVRDVRILNGGWPAWQQAGYAVSTENSVIQPKSPQLVAEGDRLAVKDQMMKWAAGKEVQIIDTRSDAEYCGTKKMAKRNGAIPGAIHLEWTEVLDSQTHKFKQASELQKLFEDKGIDLNRPSVAHCQSGGRASVMAFALELMGGKDVRNYYRSWEEWGNADDTPIEKKK